MTTMMAAINPLGRANPAAEATGGNGTAQGEASTISANDFLTLLVTEMKNQDPTAQTDPNEYINQLVQVNSLEQLIQINQNLSTALGVPTASANSSKPENSRSATGASRDSSSSTVWTGLAQPTDALVKMGQPADLRIPTVYGNLGIPKPIPAARQVAQALSGR